jgi:RNA polymerase sigma-70 factor (ECF subfamily)
MNNCEFEQFVRDNGKDILRFCRMTCGDKDAGDELYQDTMLRLFEKRQQLDIQGNVKSYALSVSILLWRNLKRKYSNRNRLAAVESMESLEDNRGISIEDASVPSPEERIIQADENKLVERMVAGLPEKYRMVVHLHYSADMSVKEIAGVLRIPEGTVKSRMNKAKQLLKKKLEALGYD